MKLLKPTLILIAVFALFVFLAKTALPNWFGNQIVAAVEENCDNCALDFEKVEFAFFKQEVRFKKPVFIFKNEQGLKLNARLASIVIQVFPLSLFSEVKKIGQVWFKEPRVEIVEVDQVKKSESQKPFKKKGAREKPDFEVSIEKIKLDDGTFHYEKKYHDKKATLSIAKIQTEIERLGTTQELIHRPIHAYLTGELERSGDFELTIETAPFVKQDEAYIDLRIKKANLSSVNPYFTNAEGVILKGDLVSAHASTHFEDNKLKGQVNVTYKDLDIHFVEKQDRSPLEVLISNAGKELLIHENNLEKDPSKRQMPIDRVRKPDESLISFLLKGMGEAAIKVASS